MSLKFLLFLLLCGSQLIAQQTVNGRVLTEDGTPAVGAYIIHLNSEDHAHTNELGNWQMDELSPGDSLKISYLGFKTTLVRITDDDRDIEVTLKESFFDLSAVTVRPTVAALNVITDIDALLRPVNNSQDILRRVPGLIIGQHAGGGKAEQIFLRGFDIDHGTDVAISVEGMPVNMVSHAHGQGYADLHFLIPETIEKIDYGKGPYNAERGNFATAGYVDFSLKENLDSSLLTSEYGSFNTLRALGLFNVIENERSNAYLATELTMTDGPFESSQHFSRINLLGRYTTRREDGSKLSVLASHFDSKWEASGQVPQRAIDAGIISRFGAIDDTEGGFTGRSNLATEFLKVVDRNTFVKTNAYYSRYDFELFSNFTFFLEDPKNGDQIRQSEDREIFGFQSEVNESFLIGNEEGVLKGGIGARYDNVDDIQLSRTKNRQELLQRLQFGDIDEINLFAYAGAEFEFGHWLINPAVRVDHFTFEYVDKLQPDYNRQQQRKAAVSPKLNFLYTANNQVQLYLKTGKGFHANDTRVVLDRSADKILPAAYGADLGGIYRPTGRLFVNAALWYLFLEQEFVYVGDAGIVEPSGKTRRTGVDLGLRYQLTDWLFADADLNYAFARSVEEPEGDDRIPLAPDLTSTGGINVLRERISGGIRYRMVRDRPANENNSIVADGYFLVDANVNYRIGRLSVGIVVENLLDAEWKETQFATESRLMNEAAPVEEIHFTPGAPFFARGVISYRF